MNRIDRNAIVGAVAAILSLLTASSAFAASGAEFPEMNKAQVEYQERTGAADEPSDAWKSNKAFVEHNEQQSLATAQQSTSQGTTTSNVVQQKSYVEYLERQALAEQVDATGISMSAWQLGLVALAGAVIGGAVIGTANSRRKHTPESASDRPERVPA